MEMQRQRLDNRALDHLGQQWDAYKKAVGHNDMTHGESGLGYGERAERIEGLVRTLAALAPPRAQHITMDPTNETVGTLINHIRDARAAVVPRRKQHDPKFKYDINRESGQAIAFVREFAGQLEGPNQQYMAQHFPHLRHAAHFARQLIDLYDALDMLEGDINRGSFSAPFTPEKRKALDTYIKGFSERMLAEWPPITETDKSAQSYLGETFERYAEALTHVHYHLISLPGKTHPNYADSIGEIQKEVNNLRYEACAGAHRMFQQISHAYRADRKPMLRDPNLRDARDPMVQALPILDRVYHARWALLADAIGDTVRSNRKILERHGMLSKADIAREEKRDRREEPNGQGRLF